MIELPPLLSLGLIALCVVTLVVVWPSVTAWWRLVRGRDCRKLEECLRSCEARSRELEERLVRSEARTLEATLRLQHERIVKLRVTREPKPLALEAWALREGWLPPSSNRGVPPDFVRRISEHAACSPESLSLGEGDKAIIDRFMEIRDFAEQALGDLR